MEHGSDTVSHILRGWLDLRRGHNVPGENSATGVAVLRRLFARQDHVRRPPDGVVAAQRVHGHQVLVLRHVVDVLFGDGVVAHQRGVLCVQRFVVAVFPQVVAGRSGHHSADQGTAVPGEWRRFFIRNRMVLTIDFVYIDYCRVV